MSKTRQKWERDRCKTIGSSESAKAAGVSPHGSRYELFAIKKGLIPAPDLSGNQNVWWGNALEKHIRQKGREDLSADIETPRKHRSQRHLGFKYISATLDGRIPYCTNPIQEIFEKASLPVPNRDDPGVYEIKTTGGASREWIDDGMPVDYLCQTQQQLMVTNYTWGILAALRLTPWRRETVYIPFVAHTEAQEALLLRLKEFWQYIVDDVPPPLDDHVETQRALEKMFPRAVVPEPVELSSELLAWDDYREHGQRMKKEGERIVRRCDAELKAELGDHERGQLSSGVEYTWKEQTRRSYEVPEKTFRVLRRKSNGRTVD